MSRRDQVIEAEARDLWRALRPDPPPDGVSGRDLLRVLIRQIPRVDYDRLVSPHLRSSLISRPGDPPRA